MNVARGLRRIWLVLSSSWLLGLPIWIVYEEASRYTDLGVAATAAAATACGSSMEDRICRSVHYHQYLEAHDAISSRLPRLAERPSVVPVFLAIWAGPQLIACGLAMVSLWMGRGFIGERRP